MMAAPIPRMIPIPPNYENVTEEHGECEICSTIADVGSHTIDGEGVVLCRTCAKDIGLYSIYIKDVQSFQSAVVGSSNAKKGRFSFIPY